MYMIYILYGISYFAIYNAILSSLSFYIKEMPDKDPDFVLGFFSNILAFISSFIVILFSHKLNYYLKNNLLIVI